MNATLPIVTGNAQRTVPMCVTFTLWRLSSCGNLEALRKELPAASLAEAVKMATPATMPLALVSGGLPSFVILETDDRAREGEARHKLHFYIVKAKREWRNVGECGTPKKLAIPYAVHSGSLAMNAFDPRRPFCAGIDDAANGRQPGEARLIEARQ